MPRGYSSNYSFVIDSNFQPFTMQEMLTPFVMYKDAFDQAEAAYTDLSDKADTFKYLSDTLPEGSRAKEIYDGYANYLHEQAQDFAKHGLNMGNRRALTDLKRRYQGEIGRLSKADEALRQERELRRKLAAQDSSILYADDNLTIDSFLDNETPNLYSISGNELYTKGAAAGKAASSRVYGAEDTGSTLGGYYRDYVQRMGYNADTIAKFRQDMSTIPELQMAADAILEANGVTSNLTGVNLDRARQQVINGMIDGAVYTESHNPTRDLGVMTKAEKASNALGWASHNLNVAVHGMIKDKDGKYVSQDEWMYTHDQNGRRNGFSPEYEEAVKKGLVPGKNIKMGDGSKPTTTGTQNPKTPKEPLKKAVKIDGNGITSPVSNGQNSPAYGKKISFQEAVEINPEIAKYHPGYEKSYDYYVSGKTVTIVPIGTTADANDANDNGDNNNSRGDNNQL